MQKINQLKISFVNIFLSIVVVAAIGYTGYIASFSSNGTNLNYSSFNEPRLGLSINSGIKLSDFRQDLSQITRVVKQEKIDQSTANILISSVMSSKPDIGSILAWNRVLKSEIKTLTQMPKQKKTNLLSQIQKLNITGELNGLEFYKLMVPKITLIKVSDDQLVAEGLLAQLAVKLPKAIQLSGVHSGDPVTNLEADLTTLNADVSLGKALASEQYNKLYNGKYSIKVINVNLATGNRDILAAINAALTVVNSLSTL